MIDSYSVSELNVWIVFGAHKIERNFIYYLYTILFTVYIKSAKAFFRFLKRFIIYNYNLLLNFIFIIDVYLPILLQCKLLCGKF